LRFPSRPRDRSRPATSTSIIAPVPRTLHPREPTHVCRRWSVTVPFEAFVRKFRISCGEGFDSAFETSSNTEMWINLLAGFLLCGTMPYRWVVAVPQQRNGLTQFR
jgi:hypothetical protein